ncbi:methyltransferase [Microbulbifer sp. A4B17]|uniref:methyltransferase n=1 Tax=Microbulbifer sp. A4B17 TaxID=359370 RepID=UPI000D52D157|nr:methyltransferase [Microbulbifer sp. A4B17]AWF80997.1 methyltransferase [Microbulbifer sp. A4B17]
MPKSMQRNRILNWIFQRASNTIYSICNIPNILVPPPFRVMQIGSLFWQSRCLYAAARLNVADYIESGVVPIEKLANDCGADKEYLYRLMRMLCAMGIFKEVKARHFSHNRNSEVLRSDASNSVKSMVLMHNSPEFSMPWFNEFEKHIKEGSVPFEGIYAQEMFDYMNDNPSVSSLFSDAMDTVDNLTGLQYLQDFDWRIFDRIIDLGGAKGSKSASILSLYTHISAVVVDRGNVEVSAREYWKNMLSDSVEERLDFFSADIIKDMLPVSISDKDVYLCTAVFHLLSDCKAKILLENIYSSMQEYHATLIIVDAVLPEKGTDLNLAAMDMQMLMGTRGRERTAREWGQLFSESPFYLFETVCVRTFAKLMVLRKKNQSTSS